MLVKDCMTTSVVSIESDQTIQDAINLLMEHQVSMLPVLQSARLVGIVTDRDVKHALPSNTCLLDFQDIMLKVSKVPVKSIMNSPPITVRRDFTIEETASVLFEHNISGAPVVDPAGNLVGIITKNDLFKSIVSVTGITHKGMMLALLIEDRRGTIREITDILRKYGGRLISIVSFCETAPKGYRHVYIRLFGMNRNLTADMEKDIAGVCKLLCIVDQRENRRQFFDS